jgi:hypothetical protein
VVPEAALDALYRIVPEHFAESGAEIYVNLRKA